MKKLITLIVIVLAIAGVTVWGITDNVTNTNKNDQMSEVDSQDKLNQEVRNDEIEANQLIEPENLKNINGLLIGFDRSNGLTDVIMIAHLDVQTHQVKLISVPRDLHIDFQLEQFSGIRSQYEIGPSYSKLTEIYGHVNGNNNPLLAVKDTVEKITGLTIDYTATINIDGFKDIVDVLGGISFDVPQNMNYDDDVQDLHIHLTKGQQLLDGDKAEQLVRFRHYKMGDLQRIQVQQDFMVAMANKILESNSWLTLAKLVTTILSYFDTDFGLVELLSYVQMMSQFDMVEIMKPSNRMTVPSYGELINELWYQKWDVEGTPESIEAFINQPADNQTTTDSIIENQPLKSEGN